MPTIQNILVPVDFSDCSFDVVERAAELAQGFGARLRLLHVVEPPDGVALDTRIEVGPQGHSETVIEHLTTDAEERLRTYLEQMPDAPAESMLRVGTPADTIIDAANEIGSDLIVMGTHGRTGLAHVLLGSVAEQVLRQSACPIVTIRSEHKARCAAKSCNWCDSGITDAARRVRAEQ